MAGQGAAERAAPDSVERQTSEIPKISSKDEAAVAEHFAGGLSSPAIFTDVITQWPAYGKWTMRHFNDAYGDLLDMIPMSFTKRHFGKAVKLRDYLSGMDKELDEIPGFWVDENQNPTAKAPDQVPQCWSFNWRPFKEYPELLDDIGEFSAGFGNLVPELPADVLKMLQWIITTDLRSIYISRKDTVTPVHSDFHDTISCLSQFEGRKRVCLIEPADLSFEDLDGFEPEAPDYKAYPKLAGLPIYSADLLPGEMVVIPPNWWRYVRSLDDTVTFSHNFITSDNLGGFLRGVLNDLLETDSAAFAEKANRTLLSTKNGYSQ